MIAFFEMFDPFHEEFVRSILSDDDLLFFPDQLSHNDLSKIKDCEILSVREHSELTSERLSHLTKLKMIALRVTGYNNVDHEYCDKHNIIVSNVPQYGSHTVAEYAFAHILNLSRKISHTLDMVPATPIHRREITGTDLLGKTLGIIGTGRIGYNSAKYGLAFGMDVIAFDVIENSKLKEMGVKYMDLNDLLRLSDVITIHVPLLPQTEHLINKGNIRNFKPGAILVNTSRGEIIDNNAIVIGMKENILSACAVDVFAGEEELLGAVEYGQKYQPGSRSQYEDLTEVGVIVTPHNAFNTKEALMRILQTTVENIHAYKDNKPENVIVK